MRSKILLADDSITIQKVVNLTFADEGIEVVAVNNGDVAARRMDEVRPDLVLADIFMPGKNGYELCEAIKNSQFRNVPVVLLVGAFEPFDQAEARRVRADAHLTKPFESRTLVETVRKLINSTAQPTGGPVPAMSPGTELNDESNDDIRAGGHDHRGDDVRDDRDTGSIAARLTSPTVQRLDLSAMMTDPGAQSPVSPRTTAELSPHMNEMVLEAFDVSVAGASASETVTATLIDTDQPFGTMELTSSGFSSEHFTSTLGLDATEPVIDFETSFESSSREVPFSFDSEQAGVLDLDVVSAEGPVRETSDQELISVEAAAFDIMPVEVGWPEQAPQIDTHVETGFEASAPGLLAVEEPLGDVLDTAPIESVSDQHSSSSDPLKLELPEPEKVATATATSTQFDFMDPLEESFQASDEVEEPAQVHKPSDAHRSADWTSPRAGAYSTAQLDSVVMPIEAAAFLKQMSAEESAPSPEVEATFSTPAPWSEEEARFTAIDIEAVSIDEPELRVAATAPLERAQSVEPLMTRPGSEPTNGASAASELSAAAIDEIVRRVITEMSDSVVREVAWEVVPDCVERVVDQLTRESLPRRA